MTIEMRNRSWAFTIGQPHPPKGKNRAPQHRMALYTLRSDWQTTAMLGYTQAMRKTLKDKPDFAWLTQLPGLALPPCNIQVTLQLRNFKLADPHNYTSYEIAWIVDGIVKAGAWEDDRPANLTVHDSKLEKPNNSRLSHFTVRLWPQIDQETEQ